MTPSTDWNAWHDAYRDPASELSRRLAFVQGQIRDVLNSLDGPVTITSACAGDGRDVLEVLAEREDADRVRVVLIETDEQNIRRAEHRLWDDEIANVEIRQADAGTTSSYAGAVPADLLLMCGVMGNIVDDDVRTLVGQLPSMCRPGTVVLWTRTREAPDLTPRIREWFAESDFQEESFFAPLDDDTLISVGRHRFAGTPAPFEPGRHLFTFVR